jgi:hypothetical protein
MTRATGLHRLKDHLKSSLLWLGLAAVLELAWVFAERGPAHLLGLPAHLTLVLLAAAAPALARHRYLAWVAALMPLWILAAVVLGARQ